MPVDDRELLWLAYPDGYLAMPGVFTLAGWRCVGVVKPGDRDPDPGTLWLRPGIQPPPAYRSGHMWPVAHLAPGGPPHERRAQIRDAEGWAHSVQAAAELGDLLPAIDWRDPITWAAAKHELATARLATQPPPDLPPVPTERSAPERPEWWVSGWSARLPGWCLELSWGVTGSVQHALLFPHVSDTLDPARALVEARMRLRVEGG